VVLAAIVLLARPADRHLRAASLLLRFADERAEGFLPAYGKHALAESLVDVPSARGPVRARLYSPVGVADAPGVVIVHGVHRLAIDEPRLMRFARSIAASGVVVLTPEVKEIADYRIDPASIETLGAAAHSLRERLGGRPVGLMGMSFAGGLALRAAGDRAFAEDIGFVVAIGAHHDMRRVLEFFKKNKTAWPDGHEEALAAHPYGALVLLYSHVESLVSPADAPAARDAIRLFLWDEREASKAKLAELGAEGRAKVEALLEGKADVPALIDEIAKNPEQASAVSPAGHLGDLRAPVFLLHGAADSVIPASETEWLAKDVPPSLLRASLITSAVEHVELRGQPSLAQQWALVRFMAGVLDVAGEN
jgi:pimeloyl-ACP methyl ester carboxylesterase